jgi:hypothetical protein
MCVVLFGSDSQKENLPVKSCIGKPRKQKIEKITRGEFWPGCGPPRRRAIRRRMMEECRPRHSPEARRFVAAFANFDAVARHFFEDFCGASGFLCYISALLTNRI